MDGTLRFRLNSPQVIAETIEGEAIMVDLTSGSYYSARGIAALVWSAVTSGASVAEITAALGRRYELGPDAVREQVTSFVADLEREGLIVTDEAAADGERTLDLQADAEAIGFTAPILEKFTDMQDLVLIDPVHEVDERGWPHAQAS